MLTGDGTLVMLSYIANQDAADALAASQTANDVFHTDSDADASASYFHHTN